MFSLRFNRGTSVYARKRDPDTGAFVGDVIVGDLNAVGTTRIAIQIQGADQRWQILVNGAPVHSDYFDATDLESVVFLLRQQQFVGTGEVTLSNLVVSDEFQQGIFISGAGLIERNIWAGHQLALTATAQDADGNFASLSATVEGCELGELGAIFRTNINNDGIGFFVWVPDLGRAGETFLVTFSATDGSQTTMTTVPVHVVDPPANSVANASFELGRDDWSRFTKKKKLVEATDAWEGTTYLRMERGSKSTRRLRQTSFDIEPGACYRSFAAMRMSDPEGGSVQLSFRKFGGAVLSTDSYSGSRGSLWADAASGFLIAPEGAHKLRVELTANPGSGTVDFDLIRVYQVESEFCD